MDSNTNGTVATGLQDGAIGGDRDLPTSGDAQVDAGSDFLAPQPPAPPVAEQAFSEGGVPGAQVGVLLETHGRIT